jgi:hypothetical protein
MDEKNFALLLAFPNTIKILTVKQRYLGTTSSNVTELIVILKHDEKLLSVRGAEIWKDAVVVQVGDACLILMETLRELALIMHKFFHLDH